MIVLNNGGIALSVGTISARAGVLRSTSNPFVIHQ